MAVPTDQELLDAARIAYAKALKGERVEWDGDVVQLPDLAVLETAIYRLEGKVGLRGTGIRTKRATFA